MGFVKVAVAADIAAGKCKRVVAGDGAILLANIGGSYYAISDKCPHMGGMLSQGKLEGNIITCPRHGTKFDVTNGKMIAGGKLAFVTLKVKDDKSYPVKLEGNDILVEI
jgi:3-phenylpropionate/trans-cinnamate dioxygenase ferredoxin component